MTTTSANESEVKKPNKNICVCYCSTIFVYSGVVLSLCTIIAVHPLLQCSSNHYMYIIATVEYILYVFMHGERRHTESLPWATALLY